jgi:hypothetical protein
MADGTSEVRAGTHEEWLAYVQPTGLVVAAKVLDDRVSAPVRQTAVDTAQVMEVLESSDARAKAGGAYIADPWTFAAEVLAWDASMVAGAPSGPALPETAKTTLIEYGVTLRPDYIVLAKGDDPSPESWLLFVKSLPPGAGVDKRGALEGWDATPSQQMERLLRETGAPAGLIIGAQTLRLITAPRGESSGWMDFPVQALTEVAGRPMLAGLKLLVGKWGLYLAPKDQRLPELIAESRKAQANVSKDLAAQVLGALHALLRGLTAATPHRIERLAADADRSHHLYEGLLAVLMRLVFLLYAEDRDLLPSVREGGALELYEENYSLRGLLLSLEEDEARYPATMVDRVGAWGRLLALFRLVHTGDHYGWIQPRGGKLFDPDAFPYLEGRERADASPNVPRVPDACVLEILRSLMRLEGNRLSYRTLDVEQIGSVYETVMGFTVQAAAGPSLAIAAGKKNHTPVFVDLAALLLVKPSDRLKWLKENTDRGKFSPPVETATKAAATVEALAAAFELGRGVVDLRASPGRRLVPAGTPLLQPTDERRRTGSHYTPRSLTEPIVKHALEPAFERLGPDAKPDQVLDLKVCDPAMGSGAFLVEACRQLGARLEAAWVRWPKTKPTIPADEDETLHARRLVSQRCLYGVDRNPMAVDLARLSLWLATLARDHEFAFLDHALKSGDSLVGLTNRQIMSLSWEEGDATLDLVSVHVRERLAEAEALRDRIRKAPDYLSLADLETINAQAEAKIAEVRLLGDAVVAAFFSVDKDKARKEALGAVRERTISGEDWRQTLPPVVGELAIGTTPLRPFHWEIEFPEVFEKLNRGFDAVVGNPPFLGGTKISGASSASYLHWLHGRFTGAGDRADIVAYFLRQSYNLLCLAGALGIVGTNTLSQGDTRSGSLAWIIRSGGKIFRATKRLRWPGEAAVVVSTVHISKGHVEITVNLDGRTVESISAFLTPGTMTDDPFRLVANADIAFEGFAPYGSGFLFANDGSSPNNFDDLRALIDAEPQDSGIIFDFLGGEDLLDSSTSSASRKALYIGKMSEEEFKLKHPLAYQIVLEKVKPLRMAKSSRVSSSPWWQFLWPRATLREKMLSVGGAIIRPRVSTHHVFSFTSFDVLPSNLTAAICSLNLGMLANLQSRLHETWASFFGSSLKDDLRYTTTDCFETFPFSNHFDVDWALEAAGRAYHEHRAAIMIAADEGLTKTYNRFHDPDEVRPMAGTI